MLSYGVGDNYDEQICVHVQWAFSVYKATPFMAKGLTQTLTHWYVTTFGWKPLECTSKFASYKSVMN